MSLSLPVQDGRLLYLDYIKALAIFLVIVYHSNFVTNPLGLALLSMCVTLFFAVNGYVMLSKRRTLSYYINKNVKLLFLILFWGFLSDGLQYVLEGGGDIKIFILHFYNMDTGYGNHLWFLVTLFILNLIYPAIYQFVNEEKKNVYFLIIILCLSTISGINLISWRFNPVDGWHGFALLYALLGFALLSNVFDIDKISLKRLVLLFLFALSSQTILNVVASGNIHVAAILGMKDVVFGSYNSLFIVIATCSLVLIFSKIKWKSLYLLNYIGRHTLAIYLLQDIFIKVFLEILGFECQGILFSLIVLLCSCLACWIFEKTKITKYIISL